MKKGYMNNIDTDRLARRDARQAGPVVSAAPRYHGAWRRSWRVFSLVLILTVLMNSVSFAVDSIAAPTQLSEGDVGTSFVDSRVDEHETDLFEGTDVTDDAPEKTLDYAFQGGGSVLLSQIFELNRMSDRMLSVETVLVPGGDNPVNTTDLLAIEPLSDEYQAVYDYRITALRYFDQAQLSVYLTDDVYTLALTNLPVETGDADLAAPEADVIYDGGAADEDIYGDTPADSYMFSLGGGSMAWLSVVIDACGMPIGVGDVEAVDVLAGPEGAGAPVYVEAVDGDYAVTVLEAFDEVWLSLYVPGGAYAVALLEGSPAEAEAEADLPEEEIDITEEPVEEEPVEEPVEEVSIEESVEEVSVEEPVEIPVEEPAQARAGGDFDRNTVEE